MKNFPLNRVTSTFYRISLVLTLTLLSAQAPALTCRQLFSEFRTENLFLSNLPSDPGTQAVVNQTRAQLKKNNQLSPIVPTSPALARFRETYLPFLKTDPISREGLVRYMESDLRIISANNKRQLRDMNRQGLSAKYDLVIVGAGVHGVISAATALKQNPNLKILIVEESDTAAANFRYALESFNINSSNRASGEDRLPLPGRGNINELPNLPVQVSDISAVKYPSANDLAQAVVVGLYASVVNHPQVQLVYGTTAEKVTQASGTYKRNISLNLNEGPYSKLAVQTKKHILSVGLGRPSFPAKVRQFLAENRDLVTSKDFEKAVPQVMTFEDVVRLMAQSNNPLKFFSGKNVAVVGTGDSANVFIEFLLGYAIQRAYGLSDAQTGLVKKIQWWGQDQRSCEAFIRKARSRYAQIGTGFRSSDASVTPLIQGIPGRVEELTRDANGKVEIRASNPSRETTQADIVIFATGFEKNLREYFSDLFPGKAREISRLSEADFLTQYFGFIEGETATSNGKPTRIAATPKLTDATGRPLTSPPIDAIVGPVAKLPSQQDLVGVIQNFVSIFNNAPRTVSATEKLTENLVPTKGTVAPSRSWSRTSKDEFELIGLSETRFLGTASASYFKSVFQSALARLNLKADSSVFTTVQIEVAYRKGTDSLIIQNSGGLDAEPLIRTLSETREFFNAARMILRNSENTSLLLSVPVTNGVANTLLAEVTYGTKTLRTVTAPKVVEQATVPLRGLQP